MLSPTDASIIGSDGRKMSKSCGNAVPLFADPNALRQLIRRYKTDSTAPDEPKDPESSGLFQIYRGIASAEDTQVVRYALEAGKMSWAQLKDLAFELLDSFLKSRASATTSSVGIRVSHAGGHRSARGLDPDR